MGTLDNLWGALPLAAYFGLAAGQARRGRGALEALLRAAVWWAAGVWVLANALGAFGALRPGPLKIAWALLAAAALADGFRRRADFCRGAVLLRPWAWARSQGRGENGQSRAQQDCAPTVTAWRFTFPRPENFSEWAAALGIGALLLLALVVAVAAPPVTVDVLNYHLPRQLMWLQQGSLAHFVTANDRQLVMPPLAEVIGLQWFALTGGDRWANLPQWFAYALLPVAVLRAARAGGATRGTAALAAWLAVCLPMAWHEASNGKNDLQGALWLTVLLWQVAEARRAGGGERACPAPACPEPFEGVERAEKGDAVFVGVTLALALLTKSTAMLFAPPLLVAGWLAWRGWSALTPTRCPTVGDASDPAAHAAGHEGEPEQPVALRVSAGTPVALVWRRAGLAALAAALLTAPFFARNLAWFGAPLGEQQASEGGDQANAAVTPGIVVSNALRNSALHLSAPWPAWNAALDRGVRAAHGALGLEVNDPRSTLWVTKFSVSYDPRAETAVGAPWHFLLIAAAVAAVLLRNKSAADWRWLSWIVAAMALLFCAALRWQPWAARLQLPVFVVGCVLAVGAGAALLPVRLRAAAGWGVALLGLLAWWPAREAAARPWRTEPTVFALARDAGQYRYHPEFLARDRDLAALARAAGVRDVQVVSVHDNAYPLMRRLAAEIPGLHFYGAPASDQARAPDALVVLNVGEPLPLFYDDGRLGGARYRLTGAGAGDGLYLPEARVRALGWERRLPAFAGWTAAKNFPLRVAEPVDLAAPMSTRTLGTTSATLTFPVTWPGGTWPEGRARLAGTVRLAAASALEFVVNGAPAGRVEFSAGEAPQSFEIWLPVRAGTNTLELRRTPAIDVPLIFTRLTIDDGVGGQP